LFVAGYLSCGLISSAGGGVTIHCLDIGQGDATLIVSASGQSLLVDGGPDGQGTNVIVPYLSSVGVTALDYMMATHYHSDHIGGLDEVYHQVGVLTTCFDRGWSYPSSAFGQYALIVSPQRLNLLDREADLAIRHMRPEQTELICRKVGAVPMGAWASEAYIDRFGEPTMATLRSRRCAAGRAAAEKDLAINQSPWSTTSG